MSQKHQMHHRCVSILSQQGVQLSGISGKHLCGTDLICCCIITVNIYIYKNLYWNSNQSLLCFLWMYIGGGGGGKTKNKNMNFKDILLEIQLQAASVQLLCKPTGIKICFNHSSVDHTHTTWIVHLFLDFHWKNTLSQTTFSLIIIIMPRSSRSMLQPQTVW